MTDFPPKVPCATGDCAYADECQPTAYDPLPCGGCCSCARACHLEYDVERAYIPETPEEYKYRLIWEQAVERGERMIKWT